MSSMHGRVRPTRPGATIYTESGFWTSSPTFFLLRVGLIVATVPLVWLWGRRHALRGARMPYSPIEEFGRSSLFVYWIHVEMVYGVISQPLHRRLSLFGSVIAMVLFGAFLFALVLIKNRLVGGRRSLPPRPVTEEFAWI